MSRAPAVVVVAAVAASIFAAIVCILPSEPIADEVLHFGQAQVFAHGGRTIHPLLSTWPTMNLVVAAPLAVLGSDSLLVARATIAAFALLAVVGFYTLAAHFDQPGAAMKTAQFFLIPIVLPYCGMVYTDIPALAAILWMTHAAVNRRFALFAVASLFAIACRQINVVWFAAGFALYASELHRNDRENWARRLMPLAVFGVGVIIAWALIVMTTGGIALTSAAQEAHYLSPRGLPNIEFAIGLGGILFAPILWSTRARVLEAMRKPRWAALLVAILLFVGFTFAVTHPYNTDVSVIEDFLRNRILFEITHTSMRWAFAVLVALAAFGFALLPFNRGAAHLRIPLYAIGAAALLPFGLVEQRYYLPLFALIWAFRAPASEILERAQLALSAILSMAVLALITKLGVFL